MKDLDLGREIVTQRASGLVFIKSCFGWVKRLIFLTKILNRINGLHENDNLEISV